MNARTWDERYAATDLVWTAGPNQFVERELADLPPGRAIDLAAGEGRNALWLAARGWQVRAVDYSQVGLDKAARLARERGLAIALEHADLTTRPAEPGAYDLVVIAYLQLPWSQLEGVLGRAAESVAPGGSFFLVGHDADNLTRGTGGPRDPGVLYSPDQVAAALTGLTIDRATQVERSVATPEGARVAIDCLVRGHRAA